MRDCHSQKGAPLRIFINYRRQDTGAYAHLVRDRLAQHFGDDAVFLDVVELKPGMQWLEQIRSRGAGAGVLLALIGPTWLTALRERVESARAEGSEDMVKHEIELALSRGSGVSVVPVVIDDALMPGPEDLPRSLRQLAYLQAAKVRHTELDRDVEALIGRLESIEAAPELAPGAMTNPENASPLSPSHTARPAVARRLPSAEIPITPPADTVDSAHYEALLSYMLGPRSIVPILGPDLGASATGGLEESSSQRTLARAIATSFQIELEPLELARIAQHVSVTAGSPDLHETIRRILANEAEPTAVHRFLAAFPRRLEESGRARRHQMIVTTSYDTALERAFDAEQEPYDLAVFMASGPDAGRFVHLPFDDDPDVVVVPNRYARFPIEDDGELQRTLIVKIHGAVDGSVRDYRWRENYVVTEDQYIEYLSHNAVERLVPVQILDKLTSAHCLFLGYPLSEWNLRVFLKRIWKGGRIESHSWAVEESPRGAERDFWRQFSVEMLSRPVNAYIESLSAELQSRLVTSG